MWTDGSAKTVFTICEAEETEGSPTEEYKSPKTGDTMKMEENHSGNDKAPKAGGNLLIWLFVLLLALAYKGRKRILLEIFMP